MASAGEISLDEKQPHGYTVRPSEARSRSVNKPMLQNHHDFNDDSKVSFSCQNGTLFLKISSALMVFSFVLQVCELCLNIFPVNEFIIMKTSMCSFLQFELSSMGKVKQQIQPHEVMQKKKM